MFAPFSLESRAKVNLALHVRGRRTDGYHELDSLVGFAHVGDRLDFAPADGFGLTVTGPFAAGLGQGENIITRACDAATALAARYGRSVPGVSITLVKNLPVASGIGGGSGDAAQTLRGLLRLAGLDIAALGVAADAAALALAVGADVPVCLVGQACRMTGIGENLRALTVRLPPAIVLVNPQVAVPTAAVFARLGLAPGQSLGSAIDEAAPTSWRNDLEAPALAEAPVIAEVLHALSGAAPFTRVAMSGSGATCFGLAESETEAKEAAWRLRQDHPDWWVAAAKLS